MYGKISVILHSTGLCDKQKNFKRVYKKLGQRGFFLRSVLKIIFAKNTLKNRFCFAHSVDYEVKTEILAHDFLRSLRIYSQNAKILKGLIQNSTLAKLFLYPN